MSPRSEIAITPRTQEALDELRDLIAARYPDASFRFGPFDDPPGVYLFATVDTEEMDDVVDLYLDRLVDLQVEEELPVYVLPQRTPERNEAVRAALARPALLAALPT